MNLRKLSALVCLASIAIAPASALLLRGGSGSSSGGFVSTSRNIINVNFTFESTEYPLILRNTLQRVAQSPNPTSPYGGFTLNPWAQDIDQNGYPNQAEASGQNVTGAALLPTTTNFPGPYVMSWDGDGWLGFSGLTCSELNLVTPGTATFTNGNPQIAFANSFSAGQRLIFTTSAAAFTANQVYYVVATGLTGSLMELSATQGGAVITPSANTTATVNGTYTKISNCNWQNVAGQSAYVQFNLSGGQSFPNQYTYGFNVDGGTPLAISSYSYNSGTLTVTTSAAHKRPVGSGLWLTFQGTSVAALNGTYFATITGASTFTVPIVSDPTPVATPGTMTAFVTNVKVYELQDETDLFNGYVSRKQWRKEIASMHPGALRFMNWTGGNNTTGAYSFLDRTTPNLVNWGASQSEFNYYAGPAYNRPSSGYYALSVAGASTGTTSNPHTTSTSMVHGEIAQFQLGQTNGLGRGPQVTISAIANNSTGTVTTSAAHNLFTGDSVCPVVPYTATGFTQLNGNCYTVTVDSSTQFELNTNTTSAGTFSSGVFTRSTSTITITNISAASSAAVTTQTNHGLSVGDPIIMNVPNGTMSTPLDMFPTTVASIVDATHFTIAVNTTGLTFSSSGAFLNTYMTLQVGSGSDRIAYPVIWFYGIPGATFGNSTFLPGAYQSFVFDKTMAGKKDGAGNFVTGAWIYESGGGFPSNDVPIEVITGMVREVNEYSIVNSISTDPISMWISTTHGGIDSNDPDQTTQKLYGANMVNTVLNGANGYAGIKATIAGQPSKVQLYVEYSNEVWNEGGYNAYLTQRGYIRWPASGPSDFYDMAILRSTGIARDIKQTFPTESQVHTVVSGQPNAFFGAQQTGPYTMLYGCTYSGCSAGAGGYYYSTDSTVVSEGWGLPINWLDGTDIAPYFDPALTYIQTTTGTGTLTDDSAMFNGTNNTSNGGGNYTGAANPTQAVTNFVAAIAPNFTTYETNITTVSGWMPSGKFYFGYEGAADWPTLAGSNYQGHILTSGDQAFLIGASISTQWGTALTNFWNTISALPHVALPGAYTYAAANVGDYRWVYAAPDTYANVSGTPTEGQALLNNGAWAAMSARNLALSP